MTHTQLDERWIKDSNECTYTGKDDHFASMVGISLSSTVFEYNDQVKRESSKRDMEGNTFLHKGKIGEKIIKKIEEFESTEKNVKDVRGYHYAKVVLLR